MNRRKTAAANRKLRTNEASGNSVLNMEYPPSDNFGAHITPVIYVEPCHCEPRRGEAISELYERLLRRIASEAEARLLAMTITDEPLEQSQHLAALQIQVNIVKDRASGQAGHRAHRAAKRIEEPCANGRADVANRQTPAGGTSFERRVMR